MGLLYQEANLFTFGGWQLQELYHFLGCIMDCPANEGSTRVFTMQASSLHDASEPVALLEELDVSGLHAADWPQKAAGITKDERSFEGSSTRLHNGARPGATSLHTLTNIVWTAKAVDLQVLGLVM